MRRHVAALKAASRGRTPKGAALTPPAPTDSFLRMFTIIGGDNREYGPVSTDQVRAWINAGRANLDTKARTIGSEEWRRLGDYPEFAPTPARSLPPAVPGMPEMPAQANPTFSVPTDMPDLPVPAPSTELAGGWLGRTWGFRRGPGGGRRRPLCRCAVRDL